MEWCLTSLWDPSTTQPPAECVGSLPPWGVHVKSCAVAAQAHSQTRAVSRPIVRASAASQLYAYAFLCCKQYGWKHQTRVIITLKNRTYKVQAFKQILVATTLKMFNYLLNAMKKNSTYNNNIWQRNLIVPEQLILNLYFFLPSTKHSRTQSL